MQYTFCALIRHFHERYVLSARFSGGQFEICTFERLICIFILIWFHKFIILTIFCDSWQLCIYDLGQEKIKAILSDQPAQHSTLPFTGGCLLLTLYAVVRPSISELQLHLREICGTPKMLLRLWAWHGRYSERCQSVQV